MTTFDINRFFSIVTASYGKRLLEKPYDQLAQTELFQKLKDQPKLARQAIEAASYALTALFEQNTDDGSPLKRAINEVLMDVGPEISKRMLNGDTRQIAIDASKYTAKLENPEEKIFLTVLLEKVGVAEVKKLADWMRTATPQDKSDILKYIKSLSPDKAMEMTKITTTEAGEIFAAFEEPKIEPPKRITLLDAIERRLRQHRDSLVQQNGGRDHGKR